MYRDVADSGLAPGLGPGDASSILVVSTKFPLTS